MRLSVVAIGRLKADAEAALQTRYADRINQSGKAVGLGPISITERRESQKSTPKARKQEEAQHLTEMLTGSPLIIALDEKGESFDSAQFSAYLARQRDEGLSDCLFIIGGADGLDKGIVNKAGLKLSLSKMTLPHGLARIICLEQIYRAITICTGHPYHRI